MIDRNLLRNGDILLFHTRGFSPMSWGIRALTQSYFNHTGLYVENVFKEGFVVEALVRGVVKTPIEKYLDEKSHILKVVRLKPMAFKDAEEYRQGILTATGRIWGKIGVKYDTWAIVWLGIKYGIRAFWNKGAKYIPQRFNPFQNRYKVFCSELLCECCYGISSIVKNLFAGEKYLDVDCSTITPKDIGKSPCVYFIQGKDVV